ncbi:MAG: AMP-binding protein [Peptococcaceae bacterium]|jgi:phenylacetate-CoA ligase|nr:AMP-binding protein [Peptococcaceae bacterium]
MRMQGIQQTTNVPYKYWSVGELLPKREMRKLQLARLREQIDYVWENSPFYRKKWEAGGFCPARFQGAEDMRRIPILEKDEIRASQEAEPPYGMMRISGRGPINRVAMTSGTTGDPVLIPFTEEDYFGVFCEGAARYLWAAGVRESDVVHVAFGFMPFAGLAGAYDASEHLIGSLVVPGGAWDSAIRLKMIRKFQVTVLIGTPTYLLHMAAVAVEKGIDATKLGLRLILTAGESGLMSIPNTGLRLERAYGCKVHDFAGTQETNNFLYTCDQGIGHISEDLVYCEVLDPETYEPVAPGEQGALVVTDLLQKTHPMIRFKTGDIIDGIDEAYQCSCGRTSSRFKGFKGRTGDIIKIKGVCVSVTGIENVIRGIEECSDNYEYVAMRDGEKDKIIVRVEPKKSLTPDLWRELRSRLATALRAAFLINMDVEIVAPDTLPIFELKAKRFRDLRP